MKHVPLIINIALTLAVAYLLFAHFSGKKPAATEETPEQPSVTLADIPRIVYVNTDTLLAKYDYFRQKQEMLAKREERAEADLQSRAQSLEREFVQAQQRVQQGTMTPNEVQALQEQLAQKEQRLRGDQQRMTQELLKEGQALQEELQGKVKSLLDSLRREYRYDYILSYGPGTGVLMVNDSLDITNKVLVRLNKQN
jgi:outer membrane protein